VLLTVHIVREQSMICSSVCSTLDLESCYALYSSFDVLYEGKGKGKGKGKVFTLHAVKAYRRVKFQLLSFLNLILDGVSS
jgi:hypothetical protein